MVTEIEGDLVRLGLEGKFDVVIQGNNCFCVQGAGLAPQFVKAFGTDQFYKELEKETHYTCDNGEEISYEEPTNNKGDINKLGTIDYQLKYLWFKHPNKGTLPSIAMNHRGGAQSDTQELYVVNCYTQYGFGRNHAEGTEIPADYEAITLCMRKLNHTFKGKHIGVPLIGCGLAGADWNIVKNIIVTELKDVDVTIVHYKAN